MDSSWKLAMRTKIGKYVFSVIASDLCYGRQNMNCSQSHDHHVKSLNLRLNVGDVYDDNEARN